MKWFLLIAVSMLACACRPHGVRCDGRLEPINATAAARRAPATTPGDP